MVQINEVPVEQGNSVLDQRSFQLSIFNYGKSPAHVLTCKGPKIEFYRDPDKDLPVPPDYGTWDWDRKFLGPRDSLPIGKTLYPFKARMEAISAAIAEDDQGRIKRGDDLVAYGLIEYTDGISPTPYKTAFCYRHDKGLPSSMGGHLVMCGPTGYNGYT
jgi:hypothetical protein